MNVLMFQGVFLPLPSWDGLQKCIFNEVMHHIDVKTLERFERGEVLSLYDLIQMTHALNVAKFIRWKQDNVLSENDCFTGFSAGIYAALYAAGVLNLEESFTLIRERATILMDAVKDEWDIYTVAGIGIEELKQLVCNEQGNVYISTIASKKHATLAVKKEALTKISTEIQAIGSLNFSKLFTDSAWHTSVIAKNTEPLQRLFQGFGMPKPQKILFSQGQYDEHLSDALFRDCIESVDWRNIVQISVERELFPVIFDETESLEKMWYANTRNKNFGIVKCAQ